MSSSGVHRTDDALLAPDGPGPGRRFFFVHLQKTAGTALYKRLKRHFDLRALYPNESDGDLFADWPQVSLRQLLARWGQRRAEIEIVTGHFPLATIELLDGGFTTLTVLREPVDRTLSFLRHYRKVTPAAHDMPLEQLYEDEDRFHEFVHNHMVKMFSLTSDEIVHAMHDDTWPFRTRVLFTGERLERAKERLATVDVLGLQDHFDEFCWELESRFGWQLGEPLYANRTAPEEAARSFRDRIAADNSMDVELYEHARKLYEQRPRHERATTARHAARRSILRPFGARRTG